MASGTVKSTQTGYLEEAEIREALQAMENDAAFKTGSSYIASNTLYSDHQIPFVEKHVAYLKSHPKLDPKHYLANLRLMMKVRS